MPRKFYNDLVQYPIGGQTEKLCGKEILLFDGAAFCNREKNHQVDELDPATKNKDTGEFHQEAFEGWVWDDRGYVG